MRWTNEQKIPYLFIYLFIYLGIGIGKGDLRVIFLLIQFMVFGKK